MPSDVPTAFIRFLFAAFLFASPVKADQIVNLQNGKMPYSFDEMVFMGWPDRNLSSFEVSYSTSVNGEAVHIFPDFEYLNFLKEEKSVVGVHFWWSPFEFVLPEMAIRIANDTQDQVFVDQAKFYVRSSEIDYKPVPVFELLTRIDSIHIINEGWGPMEDASTRLSIVSHERCIQEDQIVIEDGIFEFALGEIEEQMNFSVLEAIPSDLLAHPIVCAVGELTYKERSGHSHKIPYRTTVNRIDPPPGAPAPPSATYLLRLVAGKSGYEVSVPLSQIISPQSFDHFQIAVISDMSANYQLSGQVETISGDVVANANIEIDYFRPRSASEPSLPDVFYQEVSSEYHPQGEFSDLFVRATQNPSEPENFILYVTSDWLNLDRANRDILHRAISAKLQQLGLSEGYYRYVVGNDEFGGSGPFYWK